MKNLKKKVALLLAFVMVLSLMPMSAFGATLNEGVTLRTGPTAASGAGNGENIATPPGPQVSVQRIRIPLSVFGHIPTTAGWAGVHFRLELTGGDAARRGNIDDFDIVAAGTTANNSASARPSVPSAGSIDIAGQNVFLRLDYDGSAVAAGPTWNVTGEDNFLEFEVTVDDIRDHRSRLRVSIATPDSPTFRVIASDIQLVRWIRTDINSTHFNVAREGDVFQRTQVAGAQGIAGLRFTEVGRVESGTYFVLLEAPANYVWRGTPAVAAPSDSGFSGVSGLVASAAGTATLTLTFTIDGRKDGPQGAQRGTFVVSGLELAPEGNHSLRSEDLNVLVTLRQTGSTGTPSIGDNDSTTRVSLLLARQNLWGISVGVEGAVPTLSTGVNNGDHHAGIIRVQELGSATMLNSPIIVNVLTPGVTVRDAQIRWTGNASDQQNLREWWHDSAGDRVQHVGTTAGSSIINNNRTVVFPVITPVLTETARIAELRLNFTVAPGLGEVPIEVQVQVVGHPNNTTETLTVANTKNPLTVDFGDPVALSFQRPDFGFLFAEALANVVVEEGTAGFFGQGQSIDLFLRYSVNGIPFTAPTLGWNPQWTVAASSIDGEGLRFNVGAPTAIPDDEMDRVAGAFAGVRFTVNRASTEAAVITFSSVLSGTMFNEPGVELEVVVKGSAVQQQQGGAVNAAYRDIVAYITGPGMDLVEGPVEPPAQPGPEPTPEPPVVNEPARLTIDTTSVNSAGQPNFITYGGNDLVNLRGLFENVIPNGSLTRANSVSTFSAPQADGPMVQIMVPDPRLNESPFIRIAGQPVPAIVAAGFGLVDIGGTWYVPMSAFTDLLGYLIN
ncbi:MAG: hypothetical protein FWD90_05615 [Defluviitaleaceae bacterium]|nr:hypothetical protein [Defluviitaleaceae bacterium]